MRRKTTIIMGVTCALGFFFLAPIVPLSGTFMCFGLSCPYYALHSTLVSPSFYVFHVGGTIWNHGYLLWYAPGWTCTPYPPSPGITPGAYTCRQNGVWLVPNS